MIQLSIRERVEFRFRKKLFSRLNLQLITITHTIIYKVSISDQANCHSAHVYIYTKIGEKNCCNTNNTRLYHVVALTTTQEEDEKRKEIEKNEIDIICIPVHFLVRDTICDSTFCSFEKKRTV